MRAAFIVLPLLAVAVVPVSAQTAPQPRDHSLLHVAAYAVGGALVGGWTGYVAAQVTWSDWSDGAGRGTQRIRFSVSGAALGLLAGALIGSHHTGAAAAAVEERELAPPITTRPITAEEIRASSARTVTELLRQLRPQWLRSRGRDVVYANEDRLEAPGVRVYLNGGLLGGLDALDQVSVDAVTGVQFLAAAAAILRWGAGNEDGAILLTTSPTP